MNRRAYFVVVTLAIVAAPWSVSAQNDGATLVVPPRIVASPPVKEPSAEPSEEFNPASEPEALPPEIATQPMKGVPYLGASIEYIESNDAPGAEVRGLEIVNVDPDSPAEQAGLRGRGQQTKLGVSGETAGAMMPPLDLILMPLLKKAGKLGEDGDLIIAIDDNRVEGPDALEMALQTLKSGDTIYFTIIRQHQSGQHETLKVPVKLGAPRDLSSGADPFAQAH